jgi:hypothetical protein
MREQFVHHSFGSAGVKMIEVVEDILASYQGMRLTLRQLYYQFVVRNVFPNTEKSYKNLVALMSTARLAGLVDWDAIEDRIRVPVFPPEYANLKELVDAALHSYRLPRWKGQHYYAELWVEKDALAGVLHPLARQHHVPLLVNRGYSSQSAMYESSKRFLEEESQGHVPLLFYLGDFDPSGEDMVRDIKDRLSMFGVDVDVRKLALTPEQVKQYNPPPNPAKVTDPRAAQFMAKHGGSSWEVDALPPDVLQQIIHHAFASIIDTNQLEQVLVKEESDKKELQQALAKVSS